MVGPKYCNNFIMLDYLNILIHENDVKFYLGEN